MKFYIFELNQVFNVNIYVLSIENMFFYFYSIANSVFKK